MSRWEKAPERVGGWFWAEAAAVPAATEAYEDRRGAIPALGPEYCAEGGVPVEPWGRVLVITGQVMSLPMSYDAFPRNAYPIHQ